MRAVVQKVIDWVETKRDGNTAVEAQGYFDTANGDARLDVAESVWRFTVSLDKKWEFATSLGLRAAYLALYILFVDCDWNEERAREHLSEFLQHHGQRTFGFTQRNGSFLRRSCSKTC